MRYLLALLFTVTLVQAQTVRFETNLGNIDVELLSNDAPLNVQNFLRYVKRGAYDNSFIHRSVPGFIFQGGAYTFHQGIIRPIEPDTPVANESGVPNTRGTLAMVRLGAFFFPAHATSQWFFNVRDATSENRGATVFGRVKDAAGLAVMDRIAALPVYQNPRSTLNDLPLVSPPENDTTLTERNLVMIRSITVLEDTPTIKQNGVGTPGSYGGASAAAPGSFIEIYGSNLSDTTRSWNVSDFVDGRAPTTVDNVSVTIGGKPAFVSYVSPNQVNVQVPADLPSSPSVPVVVTYNGRSSTPANLQIKERAGGLLAPMAFRVGERQYVAAVHSTNRTFVANGSIPNIAAEPAVPGETLIFYGTGFGPVTPTIQPGEVARGSTAVTNRVEFFFGATPATVTYAGLSPDSVGLYQFNVVVPEGLSNGDSQLRVLSGGEPVSQSLWVPVRAHAN